MSARGGGAVVAAVRAVLYEVKGLCQGRHTLVTVVVHDEPHAGTGQNVRPTVHLVGGTVSNEAKKEGVFQATWSEILG